MILYIATTNPGKLRDFATAAQTFTNITILPLPNLKDLPAPEEDQPTFEGNARLKALYYSTHAPGQIILADDSGLEVDALSGAPGVRSARYAEDHAYDLFSTEDIDTRNNNLLIHQLTPHTQPRTARYQCVLAAARNGEVTATASGSVEGEILLNPRGTGGFGYDPLFLLPERNQTMAEIDLATKLTLSHRGRALTALLPKLTPYF